MSKSPFFCIKGVTKLKKAYQIQSQKNKWTNGAISRNHTQ